MATITTTARTFYSRSAVITVTARNNSRRRLALDEAGNIYRIVRHGEEVETVDAFEANISEQTEALIAEFVQNGGGYYVKLDRLDKVQQYELLTTPIAHCPLFECDINLYHAASKVLELQAAQREERKRTDEERDRTDEQRDRASLLARLLQSGMTFTAATVDGKIKEYERAQAKAKKDAEKAAAKEEKAYLAAFRKKFGKDAVLDTVTKNDWRKAGKGHWNHAGATTYRGRLVSKTDCFKTIETLEGQVVTAKY